MRNYSYYLSRNCAAPRKNERKPRLEQEADRLIGDKPPEDLPPAVWPGNDVDWREEE